MNHTVELNQQVIDKTLSAYLSQIQLQYFLTIICGYVERQAWFHRFTNT